MKALGQAGLDFIANKYKELDKKQLKDFQEDSTHRVVTDAEKQNWNKKFELPDGKENQVLTKTTNGAEFKEISSSRSATFVIANYDSSENSKAGADYVIQESDCAAEIINSFIGKLPEYGGKIQLTEGNFNIKKNESINFTKNNTIIEGYGNATTIIDRMVGDSRSSVIVNISSKIEKCRLSHLNVTHETSNSINIRGNKNIIKNVNIINNGSYPSIIINDTTSKNILENCSVTCNASYCYWIKNASEQNEIINCIGETKQDNNDVFHIEGKNNKLSNCSVTTMAVSSYAFNVMGESNQLLNCFGMSDVVAFEIKGTKTRLLNCKGVSTDFFGIDVDGSSKGAMIINCVGVSQGDAAINVNGREIHIYESLGISEENDGIRASTNSYDCVIINCTAKSNNKSEYGMSALGNNSIFINNIIYGSENIYSSHVRLKQNNITL